MKDKGTDENSTLWHRRLGNIGDEDFPQGIRNGCWRDGPTLKDVSKIDYYVVCDIGKL